MPLRLASFLVVAVLVVTACGPGATEEPPPQATPTPTPTIAPVETPEATETPGETETPATSACQPGDPAAANVFISGFAFGPPVTTVPVGGTITWLNQDAVGHTATADDGTFDCRPLGSSASLSFTFTTPGVVDYHCAIHPTMRGQIHVVE